MSGRCLDEALLRHSNGSLMRCSRVLPAPPPFWTAVGRLRRTGWSDATSIISNLTAATHAASAALAAVLAAAASAIAAAPDSLYIVRKVHYRPSECVIYPFFRRGIVRTPLGNP